MKHLRILVLLILFPAISHAGLLLEPYAGYQIGFGQDTAVKYGANDYDYESKSGSGMQFGGRIGYSILGVFGAFDYSMTSFTVEDKIISWNGTAQTGYTSNKTDVDQTAMGLTVGYEFPILFRVWGKYLFNVDWDMPKDTAISNTTTSNVEASGNGIAVGVAYTSIPFINIFAEYQKVTIDRLDKAIINGADEKGNYSKYRRERSSILVGISAPFDLDLF